MATVKCPTGDYHALLMMAEPSTLLIWDYINDSVQGSSFALGHEKKWCIFQSMIIYVAFLCYSHAFLSLSVLAW